MVDEDGKFTELAGPELKDLSVMSDGTEKGNAYMLKDAHNMDESNFFTFLCMFCCCYVYAIT